MSRYLTAVTQKAKAKKNRVSASRNRAALRHIATVRRWKDATCHEKNTRQNAQRRGCQNKGTKFEALRALDQCIPESPLSRLHIEIHPNLAGATGSHQPTASPCLGLGLGTVGGRAREPSAEVPLAAIPPESSPRHAPFLGGPYGNSRSGSMPPGHVGGMLPPAGRSPERMRAPLSYGPYDGPMSERELIQRERERERERELMAGDRYSRRMHGEPMIMDDPYYDRYGPRGPPSGPLGPPSSKSASSRAYDERGPPPPLPYPPASPTQSRDGDRRKEKSKSNSSQPGASGRAARETSVPAPSRPGLHGGGRPDERGANGPIPPHFDPERPSRSGPPPPMGPVRESSVKLESGPRRPPLSPTSERGAPYRDGPPHRVPSVPPYGAPPSDRDIRERDRELALQREREYEAENERQRLRLLEREQREREMELEREREREMERDCLLCIPTASTGPASLDMVSAFQLPKRSPSLSTFVLPPSRSYFGGKDRGPPF